MHPDAEEITAVDAAEEVARARRRLGSLIHEPALSAASAVDKSFLLAMVSDDGPSKMADIQRRLGVDINVVSQYRLRLIAAELIYSARRGYVDFALPYLRDYLRPRSGRRLRAGPALCLVPIPAATAGCATVLSHAGASVRAP